MTIRVCSPSAMVSGPCRIVSEVDHSVEGTSGILTRDPWKRRKWTLPGRSWRGSRPRLPRNSLSGSWTYIKRLVTGLEKAAGIQTAWAIIVAWVSRAKVLELVVSEGISVIGGLQMFELTVHWSLSFDPVLCSILHPRDVSRADSDHISIITGFFRFIRTVAISFNDSITNKFPSIKGSA